MRRTKRSLGLTGVCMALLALGRAEAATSNANLAVSATVAATVEITLPPASLPSVDSSAGASAANSFSVSMPAGLSVAVRAGQGLNQDASSTGAAPVRRMAVNGAFLVYQIYQNAALTIPWGETSGAAIALIGTGSAISVNFYVRVLPGQNVPPGTYTDTITLTFEY
jgi:spore coat protein U-like protein